jgi:hypothetical protein
MASLFTLPKLFASLILSCSVHASIACSCDGLPDVKAAVASADVVFRGWILSKYIDYTSGLVTVRMLANAGYKGVAVGDTLAVSTHIGDASCGYQFNGRGEFVVYAWKTKPIEQWKDPSGRLTTYWTHLCTRTTEDADGVESASITKALAEDTNGQKKK